METFSISFTLGKAGAAHGANVAHNNRKYLADNVRPGQVIHNINFKMQRIESAYQELFEEAVAAYNARQTRPCRRIEDYYSHIANGHREEPFYEVIVQFGDCQTVPPGSPRWDAARRMLCEYMDDFEKRNPNLHVFNASLHLDEASPHLHIDFIPFYTKERQRGLKKGVSMRAALAEQGFSPQNARKNQLEQWEEAERLVLESILHRNGYAREDKNAHYQHMEIPEYKTMQDAKRMKAALRQMEHVSASDLSAESVRKLKAQLSTAQKTVRQLEAEKKSPYQSFFYASDDKQIYVQQEMTRRSIPYREAENGFEAQECYLKEIREIERSYKTPATTQRDRLREDIDRALMGSSSFQELLQQLAKSGYQIKPGKYIAVKPPNGERYIRLKSLGEFYSEWALRNRIKQKLRFEKQITDEVEKAIAATAPNTRVLQTVHFYMETFVKVSLPMRTRQQEKPFAWTNDAELDRLLALNNAINHGKTLASIHEDFRKLTEQEAAAYQAAEQIEAKLKRNCELKECCEVLFNGKRSEMFSYETVKRLVANTALNRQNYGAIDSATQSIIEELKEARLHQSQIREQLQKSADILDIAEKVFGGTYVQSLVCDCNNRKLSDYMPSGYFRADRSR